MSLIVIKICVYNTDIVMYAIIVITYMCIIIKIINRKHKMSVTVYATFTIKYLCYTEIYFNSFIVNEIRKIKFRFISIEYELTL